MPNILVVEDDENLNRGITFSLKKSGYEVFSAESVKKAKRIASDNNCLLYTSGEIDLIITKSISRFARNTVTVLKFARKLKELGVGIFLKRKISILSMQRAKCCLPFFLHWHRTRANPFQKTAHGESAEGLKPENTK